MERRLHTSLQKFQHLKIPLEEIKSATNNFDGQQNLIGAGGFGNVYKGEVSHSKGRSIAAIKRLDDKGGQGKREFQKEIEVLSEYSHGNLISLLGFCYQEGEMILVYEHASRGSLDRYLNSPHLTLSKRLMICLDVAKVLSYLHDPRETHHRIIHCDIKSANILLDDQWNGKLSDCGLSVTGLANEEHSVTITPAAGTYGYCDPEFAMTDTLTKESDVYSFGVVLFEVLCGRLCCSYSNGRVQHIFVPMWIESYEQKKLNDIIFKSLPIEPLEHRALEIFSDIAYQCLKESRGDRPKMSKVVTELEAALESQEFSKWLNPLIDYEEMSKNAESPLNCSSKDEVRKLLSKGVLLKGGKTWISLNKKGERCGMISFTDCLDSHPSEFKSEFISRFTVGPYHYKNGKIKIRVKPQFLSPGITYTVNLVFKFTLPREEIKRHDDIALKYKLQGETKSSISYHAYEREDGWWMCELYQFVSEKRTVDLKILFNCLTSIEAEGIEFWPLEKVEHKDENQNISYSDANWEEKLPTDYEDIMKLSKNSMQWTTKKEAYSIIRKGFLIRDGNKGSDIWFALDKNGRKCHMLPARAAATWNVYSYMLSLPESRFGEAFQCIIRIPNIISNIRPHLVSSDTTYASYLVYKLPKDQSEFQAPILVEEQGDLNSNRHWYIFLASPQTPVIGLNADQNTHNPLNRPKVKGLPQRRNDDWMEVQIWEFRTTTTTEMIPVCLALGTSGNKNLSGLIVEGIEFRPI